MKKQRDLVLLGQGGGDPIEKLANVLNAQRTKNLFIFPQGMISL